MRALNRKFVTSPEPAPKDVSGTGTQIDRRSGAQTPPARSMVPARTCRDEREPMELAFLARDRAPRGQGMNSPRR